MVWYFYSIKYKEEKIMSAFDKIIGYELIKEELRQCHRQ